MIKLYADDRVIMSFPDSYDAKPFPTNCPNCGAPITNDICEYCGTRFMPYCGVDLISQKRQKIQELESELRQKELEYSQIEQTNYILEHFDHDSDNYDYLVSLPIMTKESWIKRFLQRRYYL